MTSRTLILAGLLTGVLAASGCSSVSKGLGLKKNTPNEFNILTKPPLVVPPQYNLRPPQTGELDVEEKFSTVAARKVLLGEVDPAKPSPGEAVLISKAGGGRADPAIRVIIDAQNSIERKNRGFADRVLFWRNGKAVGPDGKPLDPDQEVRRQKAVTAATGGKPVQINRRPAGAKLPGL